MFKVAAKYHQFITCLPKSVKSASRYLRLILSAFENAVSYLFTVVSLLLLSLYFLLLNPSFMVFVSFHILPHHRYIICNLVKQNSMYLERKSYDQKSKAIVDKIKQ